MRSVSAPYVAFAEDDSWYAPGALGRAADLLDAHPEIALLQAHVLVARGRMLEALGDPSAAEVIDAAGACRAGLGIDGGGWDTLFRLAAAEHRAAAAT